MKLEIHAGGHVRHISLGRTGSRLRAEIDGRTVEADAVEVSPGTYSILLNGESHEVRVTRLPGGALKLQSGGAEYTAEVFDPRAWRGRRHGALESEGPQQISAPMPGKVVRVLVQTGDRVEAGQGLMVVEAMKMQNEIKSPKSGVVERILVAEGQAVNSGEVLAWIE